MTLTITKAVLNSYEYKLFKLKEYMVDFKGYLNNRVEPLFSQLKQYVLATFRYTSQFSPDYLFSDNPIKAEDKGVDYVSYNLSIGGSIVVSRCAILVIISSGCSVLWITTYIPESHFNFNCLSEETF